VEGDGAEADPTPRVDGAENVVGDLAGAVGPFRVSAPAGAEDSEAVTGAGDPEAATGAGEPEAATGAGDSVTVTIGCPSSIALPVMVQYVDFE
jgi:hypothetical protein